MNSGTIEGVAVPQQARPPGVEQALILGAVDALILGLLAGFAPPTQDNSGITVAGTFLAR